MNVFSKTLSKLLTVATCSGRLKPNLGQKLEDKTGFAIVAALKSVIWVPNGMNYQKVLGYASKMFGFLVGNERTLIEVRISLIHQCSFSPY